MSGLFAEMVSWVISAAWFQVTQGPSRSIKLAPIDRSLTTYVCRYNQLCLAPFSSYSTLNNIMTLKSRLRVTLKSWEMAPFDRSHTSSYSASVATMVVFCTVFKVNRDRSIGQAREHAIAAYFAYFPHIFRSYFKLDRSAYFGKNLRYKLACLISRKCQFFIPPCILHARSPSSALNLFSKMLTQILRDPKLLVGAKQSHGLWLWCQTCPRSSNL